MRVLDRVLGRSARGVAAAWILSLTVLALVSVLGTKGLYPSDAARQEAALGLNASRALVALYGPVPLDGSLGALAVVKLLGLGSLGAALGGSLVATRLSRGLEESGELILLSLGPRGWRVVARRGGHLALFGGLILALLLTLASFIGGLPLPGSVLLGADLGLAWTFGASLSLWLAQSLTHARSVRLSAATVLALSYLLRALGDSTAGLGTLSTLSPFHWVIATSPFSHPRPVVLLPLVALDLSLVIGAERSRTRRDLGGPSRETRRRPMPFPTRLSTLWWRRHRLLIVVSAAVTLLVSAALAGASSQVSRLITSNRSAQYLAALGGPGGVKHQVLSLAVLSGAEVSVALGVALLVSRRRDERVGALRLVEVQPPSTETIWWSELGRISLAVLGCSLAGLGVLVASPRRELLVLALSRLAGTALLLALSVVLGRRGPLGALWAPLAITVLASEVAPLARPLRELARLSPYWWIGSSFTPTSIGALIVEILLTAGLMTLARSRRAAREWT